jgi:putative FmdB family regulatory protein
MKNMPIYRYKCKDCGEEFTVMHSMSEKPDMQCEECGAEAEKIIGNIGIAFKGSGYYVNDSKKSDNKAKTK